MKSSDNFAEIPGDIEVAQRLKGINSCAVILCAGLGLRTGLGYNKMFYRSGETDVITKTLTAFDESLVSSLVIACASGEEEEIKKRTAVLSKPAIICFGGQTRTDSVRSALKAVPVDAEIVAIHDGARPFVTPSLINRSLYAAAEFGGAVAAVPSVDTIRIYQDAKLISSPLKADTINIQTPQTFRRSEIVSAYSRISGSYDDDAAVYIKAGFSPVLIMGEYKNKKITTKEDLMSLSDNYKIGTGFDVHRFTTSRKLILGGVEIPFDKGLLGHSDADVLTHAIMDALLSAAGLPDIGVLFPDTNPAYEGISSMKLLASVKETIIAAGYEVQSISGVIMAEKPKMAPIIPKIRQSLANLLEIETEAVNISATTTEKLGIIGNEQGIASSAVALLKKTI